MKKALLLGLGLSICVGGAQAGIFDAIKPYAKVAGVSVAVIATAVTGLVVYAYWVIDPKVCLDIVDTSLQEGDCLAISKVRKVNPFYRAIHAELREKTDRPVQELIDLIMSMKVVRECQQGLVEVVSLFKKQNEIFGWEEALLRGLKKRFWFGSTLQKINERLAALGAFRKCLSDVVALIEQREDFKAQQVQSVTAAR